MARPKYRSYDKTVASRLDDAILGLLPETPIAKVSVRMLCDMAGCNHSTFYYHYDSVLDLEDHAIKKTIPWEIVQMVLSALSGMDSRSVDEDRYLELLDSNKEKLDWLCLMLAGPNNALVREAIHEEMLNVMYSEHGNIFSKDDIERTSVMEYALGGTLAVLAFRGSKGNSFSIKTSIGRLIPHAPNAIVRALE